MSLQNNFEPFEVFRCWVIPDKRQLEQSRRDNARDVTRVLVASAATTCLNELVPRSSR